MTAPSWAVPMVRGCSEAQCLQHSSPQNPGSPIHSHGVGLLKEVTDTSSVYLFAPSSSSGSKLAALTQGRVLLASHGWRPGMLLTVCRHRAPHRAHPAAHCDQCQDERCCPGPICRVGMCWVGFCVDQSSSVPWKPFRSILFACLFV